MNRELKFRAWDNERNEWLFESNEHALTWYGFHIIGECTEFFRPSLDKLQHLVFEQYTGRKDKNRKEIYEGDLVILRNEIPRGDGQFDDAIFEIKYDLDCAGFIGVNEYGKEYLGHLEPDEVIGNIHTDNYDN